jgi:LysM repeat protein
MVIEDEIEKYAKQYDVDVDLARAVCLHESGGNANLNSWAGANGYFQVMPATFRSLRVEINIEAGLKYLSQMIRRFAREDYALAGYNGGPGRVSRGRPPLESLPYVLAVGQYRNVLKLYDRSVRHHAQRIGLEEIQEGDDWWTVARRVGVSVLQLRMHNPFLATRALQAGQLMAYPPAPRTNLFAPAGDDLEYQTRHGDNYLHLAFIMEVDRDVMREANNLWRIQTLPAGQVLRIPLKWKGKYNEYRVQPGDNLKTFAARHQSTPWRIIRDNGLFWDEQLTPGTSLKVRPVPSTPTYVTHRVSSGDTLAALASRYRTSIRAVQAANNMGRRTLIRVGQRLRIPTRAVR